MSLRASDGKLGVRVGAVTLVLLVLGVAYVVLLRGKLFLGPSVDVELYFAHVGSLKEGAPVMVAGRAVGKITAIRLVPRDLAGDDHLLADTGGAVAILRIDARRRGMVPINGEFFVSSRGLLSERYVEVGAPADGAPPGRPVADGDQVRGIDPPSMDRVLTNTWNNLTVARAFLSEVQPEGEAFFAALRELGATLDAIEPGPDAYAALADRAAALAAEARTTYLTLQAGGLDGDRIAGLLARSRQTVAQLGTTAAMLRGRLDLLQGDLDRLRDRIDAAAPGLRRKLDRALDAGRGALAKLEVLSAKVDDLLGIIARGEGTIGRIQHDPEFPEDAKELGKILKRTPWRVIGHPQDLEP
ncbi:MAG: MCE family protein [Kofleriaceae bacterium]|nr:MCE family protein [Myxococcales bacterium]MCB9564829.1 MCE family protein [Kofleriaceae bacterium]MCB9574169.1 MCE family protein [Kofleriaceae bacterium]